MVWYFLCHTYLKHLSIAGAHLIVLHEMRKSRVTKRSLRVQQQSLPYHITWPASSLLHRFSNVMWISTRRVRPPHSPLKSMPMFPSHHIPHCISLQCRSRVKIIGGAHHERQSHEVLGSPGECSSGKFLLGGPGPPRPLPTLRHCSAIGTINVGTALCVLWLSILTARPQ